MAWSVVVPTNRPERFLTFLDAWHDEFRAHNVTLLVIQDLPETHPEVAEAVRGSGLPFELHDWRSIPEFIPRKSDMIRSWGVYRASLRAAPYVLSLDDDVLPGVDVFGSYERVFDTGAPLSDYLDVGALTTSGKRMRGFPFRDRRLSRVGLQFGGWSGVLDYDACQQLSGVNDHEVFRPVVLTVPKGAAVTGCIMNAAWRKEFCPIVWQLPLYQGRFNRFGDIWAGLFAKKTLDALGVAVVVNGEASVRHERASDPLANLERELPGIAHNERLWDELYDVNADGDLLDVYVQVTDGVIDYFNDTDILYAAHFALCRDEWLDLYR